MDAQSEFRLPWVGLVISVLLLAFILCSTIGRVFYNLYFHPLRSYPGSVLARATRLTYIYWEVTGVLHIKIKEWHDRYGEVVRIAPNELSYNSSRAWMEICGHRSTSKETSFEKDMTFFNKSANGVDNIVTTGSADHRRMRRLLAHAFSDKALRGQEPILTRYVDLMIMQLYKRAATSPKDKSFVDLVSWYNFATFDIVGDLAYGESFGCLVDGVWHRWIRAIFSTVKVAVYLRNARRVLPSPLKEMLLLMVLPKGMAEERKYQYQFSVDQVTERMKSGSDREDFMSYILRANDEKGLTTKEIEAQSQVFIIAGSETTATSLSGATYLLLKNPTTLQRLTQEIRTSFQTEQDINVRNTLHLPYLNAVLEESLRMYPPAPNTFPRTTPEPGETICGRFVPAGTSVGIHQWSTMRSERNFRDPNAFLPERWLDDSDDDSRFADDDKKAFQPFSYGPRNCLGRNLAYAEMRLIISKLLYNFDLELQSESENWIEQKTYMLWEKGPLNVRLVPMKRDQ